MSNKITSISWGKVVLETGEEFKDVMLAPSLAKEWDWAVSGTNHLKGIQISDIDFLLKHGIDGIVLSRGMHLKLNISAETLSYVTNKLTLIIVDESKCC